jgi:hypothetical protein
MWANTLITLAAVGAALPALAASEPAQVNGPAFRTAQHCVPPQEELPGATKLYCGRWFVPAEGVDAGAKRGPQRRLHRDAGRARLSGL